MRVLDLFSGIGGFSLGLERAGMRTVAFCEIDPYCRAVLRKHWPDVPVFGDVRTFTVAELASEGILPLADTDDQGQLQQGRFISQERRWARDRRIDVICGGFPCQDISVAGKGAGMDGARSGLWSEYARIIGEVRPCYVIVENVAALLGRGLGRVLGDLAALGYDAEWHCIPAAAVGAPHRRDRVWIIAADASQQYVNGRRHAGPRWRIELANNSWWLTESDVGRVAHGVPARVDRLRALGNAIVPQIAEIIGRAIMDKKAAPPYS